MAAVPPWSAVLSGDKLPSLIPTTRIIFDIRERLQVACPLKESHPTSVSLSSLHTFPYQVIIRATLDEPENILLRGELIDLQFSLFFAFSPATNNLFP